MNKFFRIAITALLLSILSLSVLAHTPMRKSSPANNEVLATSPKEISLQFGAPVNLVGLTIVNASGDSIDTGFKPDGETKKEFVQAVPTLENGSYTIEWRAMGDDAHRLTGKVRFSIDASKAAQ